MDSRPRASAIAAALLAALALPGTAHAYLDPGTGSYALQLVLAGVAAGLYSLKLSWHRIRGLSRRLLERKRDRDGAGA